MRTYVRLEHGIVAEDPIEREGDIAGQFHRAQTWVDVTGLSPVPQQRWSTADGGMTFTPPADPDLTLPNKAEAQALLDTSDITMNRCVESGVAVPAEWKAYRVALRSIRSSGSLPSAGWPVRPAYPAGT